MQDRPGERQESSGVMGIASADFHAAIGRPFLVDFAERIRYYAPRLVISRQVFRRGAGVAEQGCLLSSYTGKTGIGGSNPPLSASPFVFN
jgi:hypothetical protein